MQLIEDVKKILGFTDDSELAKYLGKSKSAISKWRFAGEIPAKAEKELREILNQLNCEDGLPDIAKEYSNKKLNLSEIGNEYGMSIRHVPIISSVQAGENGFFEDCYPVGCGMGTILWLHSIKDENVYALSVKGDSMSNKFEQGDIVVVSPKANVNSGDSVVVKTQDGQVMIKNIKHKNDHVVLSSCNAKYEDIELKLSEIKFIHKVVDSIQT